MSEPTEPTERLLQHPALRPGTRVVRHDDGRVRVGLDAPRRTLVQDDPEVRRLLAALRRGEPVSPRSPVATVLLQRLLAADLLVDGSLLRDPPRGWPPATVAALVAAAGPDAGSAAARAARRTAAGVGLSMPADLRAAWTTVVTAGGLPVVPIPGHGPVRCSVALVVADGEPPRRDLDRLLRDDVPHLVVSLGATTARTGPFVVPGLTACQRCLDAHQASDPGRALVLDQPDECVDPPEAAPRDPALAALALGHAVSEVLAFVDGGQPLTWSASVTWRSAVMPERTRWTRHPHCGCTWGDSLAGRPAG